MTVRMFPWIIVLIIAAACCPQAEEPAAAPLETDNAAQADEVKEEFLHAWKAYVEFAWGHDELTPLSMGHRDWHEQSLMITAVDVLDTLILFGLEAEAGETREFIATHLSLDKDITVKNFEITIRLLGGLLSSYQLSSDKRLLTLAKDLGDRLLPVFDSPTGMPYMFVNLKTGGVSGAVTNPAEIGTLMLEFGTLSKLTGDGVYYDKAKRAVREVFDRRSQIGLIGRRINVETGEWVATDSHVGGEIDSYFEYLLKAWMLFDDDDFKRMFDACLPPLEQYLLHETDDGLWLCRVDMKDGRRIAAQTGALEAFFPGLLVQAGRIETAARLQDSFYRLWMMHGIEPESYNYEESRILNPAYHLRPEIVESAWYLYKATGEDKYRRMGLKFLDDLRNYCRVEAGYAELADVVSKEKRDRMESFFLSETLKYLYLLLGGETSVDISKAVFTTEAHPLFNTWYSE